MFIMRMPACLHCLIRGLLELNWASLVVSRHTAESVDYAFRAYHNYHVDLWNVLVLSGHYYVLPINCDA